MSAKNFPQITLTMKILKSNLGKLPSTKFTGLKIITKELKKSAGASTQKSMKASTLRITRELLSKSLNLVSDFRLNFFSQKN